MPEAPEAQSVLNYLEQNVKDVQIISCEITHPKLSANMDAAEMEKKLAGQHFRSFFRLGKYLGLVLDDYDLIAHMRMEGKFFLLDEISEDERFNKHIHAKFYLNTGKILAYHDTRKFGRMNLYEKTDTPAKLPVFENVGLDVLSEDMDGRYLYQKIHKKKTAIKTALLDQSVIAGIGNIYADEILFSARLHPATLCNELTEEECEAIVQAEKKIMKEAMECNGTTIRTYAFDGMHAGSFQQHLQVHDRKDEPCPHCHHPIEQILINKRSTYLCPHCQPLKKSA